MSLEHCEDDNTETKERFTRLKRGFAWFSKYTPMLVISLALHLVLLLIISLLSPKEKVEDDENKPIIIHQPDIPEPDAEDTVVIIEPIDVMNPTLPIVDSSISIKEKSIAPPIDNDIIVCTDETIHEPVVHITSIPSIQDIPDLIGLKWKNNGGSSSSIPKGYNNRSGKNKSRAINDRGGDLKTEASVKAALKWLALHQEPDGSWLSTKYEGKDHAKSLPACTTACALLPFLGAGHSEKFGKYKKTVKKGIYYLNKEFKKNFENPQFKSNYGASLILMALSEASIFGSTPTTRKNANRLAEYLIDQYLKNPGEGWNYTTPGSDFSVSGWVSLGLKSAKSANLPVMKKAKAKSVFDSYKKWVETMTNEETGMGSYRPGKAGSTHMTWVGMFVRQSLGYNTQTDKFLTQASKLTIDWVNKGSWIGKEKPGAVYGIYYGTLAAFQQQGKVWSAWNPAMKRTLVGSQLSGDAKELGGSWNPSHDHTGEIGGRVYTTALHALCLEVYYRYNLIN